MESIALCRLALAFGSAVAGSIPVSPKAPPGLLPRRSPPALPQRISRMLSNHQPGSLPCTAPMPVERTWPTRHPPRFAPTHLEKVAVPE
eukprot:311497-Chlamydomonas_euryale.AAC.1